MRSTPFWVRNETPALVLAPMEGVTDAIFRELFTDAESGFGGFDFCVTEFLRVTDTIYPKRVFLDHMPELSNGSRTRSGTPVVLQILGGNPTTMAENANRAIELGAAGIDLNFGCPAPTVNRNDGGASILRQPERVESITRAVRDAVPAEYPVSVKIRLGWDSIDEVEENARRAASGGASWLTIHARTRTQLYKPPAFWEKIRAVRAALSIPVFANGDIWALADFERCREQSRCDHFMLGRGALSDPGLAFRLRRQLGLSHTESRGAAATGSSPQDWKPFLSAYCRLSERSGVPDFYRTRRMKQWLRYAGMRQKLEWFDSIKTLQTSESILSFVN